jgi:hypothetical protein
MTDPIPADIVEYEHALSEFHRCRPPAVPGDHVTFMRAWQAFLLWRVAESLSDLAGAEYMKQAREDGDEPWKNEPDDDE